MYPFVFSNLHCDLLQILQVFDSCAGELGPDQFNTFALPYLKDIAYRTREKLTEANLEQVPLVGKALSLVFRQTGLDIHCRP